MFSDIILNQNNKIVDILAEHTVLLKKFSETISPNTADNILQIFPLETKKDLEKFEKDLSESQLDQNAIILGIQKIIKNGGFNKNIQNLLSHNIILSFNYDGIHKKDCFKIYERINTLFYKAIKETCITKENYVLQLKKAFTAYKGRHYKNTCLEKKNKANEAGTS